MTFAERLRAAREKAGLRPVDLARAAGLTRQSVGHLEQGIRQPSWQTVQQLVAALGCRFEDLACDPPPGPKQAGGPKRR